MKKVVFITGISSGFGLAIATQLAAAGPRVYGTSRKSGFSLPGVVTLKADVTQMEEVEAAVAEVIRNEGCLDVLINNAGIGLAGAIEDFREDEAFREINTNLLGVYRTTRCVLPVMRSQNKGTIITISSIAGMMGIPFQGFYASSKFAVEGLMQALRYEVAPFDIQVVMVNPGDFRTGFTGNRQIVGSNTGGAYHSAFEKTLNVIEHDENSGLNAEVLAKKILKIVEMQNPAHRYVVASVEQKLAVMLQRILPAKLFFRILASHYKIK